MRRTASILGAAGLAAACVAGLGGAAKQQPLTPAQAAIAAHYTNNDPAWVILRDTAVTADRAKGLLTAAFGPRTRVLAGKPFTISGFMSPLEASGDTRHFIVTRRSTTCPFCPPNEPTEAVEVFTTAPVRMTDAEVVVSGRMELTASSDEGLFYRLRDAAQVRR